MPECTKLWYHNFVAFFTILLFVMLRKSKSNTYVYVKTVYLLFNPGN